MQRSQGGERCLGRNAAERRCLAGTAQGLPQPGLQPRRVPAWGTRRAPEHPESPSLRCSTSCRGGTGGMWRKGLTCTSTSCSQPEARNSVLPSGQSSQGESVQWVTGSPSRVSRALRAGLFLLSVALTGISAPIHSWLQDLMDSALLQARACGCGCCAFVPGVCIFTISEYEASTTAELCGT